MQDAWLGRLFVRFRDKGDGKALAAVFDATARELLGVAAHLVPTSDQAEDAVQTTFQRAIEHAARFDGERSLKGWLYGILWREAAKIARTERRALAAGPGDPDALGATIARAPAEEAAAEELPEAVRAALARLPALYREVLEPVLFEERSAREVAAHLARSPGTVRVQLQRGLERLRRELPAAQRRLAGSRALGVLGLARLRERVLAHAGFTPAAVPAASAAFLAWQLAGAAATPLALVSGTAFVAALGTGVVQLARGEPHPGDARATVALAPARTELAPAVPGVLASPAAVEEAEEERASGGAPARGVREPRAGTRARPAPVPAPQVTGTVVDERESPLPDVEVQAEAENHYGFERTTSDEAGRFAFGALAAGRWYFHVDDERYARMWWQTHGVGIEEDVGESPQADLELVLRPALALAGTVVDPTGAPLAGAKVTLAVEWPEGEPEPLQGHLTNELAVVTTDGEGRFVLERLSRGKVTVVLDHPDFARTIAQMDVPGPPPRLVISGGMELDGTVVASGAPLAGVSVAAHSTRQSHLTMGDWRPTTDESGRFHLERVAPMGETRLHGVSTLTLAVEDEHWSSDRYAVFESAKGELPPVTLEAFPRGERQPKSIEVGRDREGEARLAGEPFGSAVIRVRVAPGAGDAEPLDVSLSGLSAELRSVFESGSVEARASHAFEHLAAGRYRLSPENRGATNYAPVTVDLESGEVREVVLRPGELRLAGRVTCAGKPLTSGSVWARSIRNGAGQRARGTLDAGNYEIRGLVAGSYELLLEDEGALVQSFEVAVAEPETAFDLELPPGRIEGRLAFARSAEDAEFRVMVFPYGWYQESGNRGVFVDPDAGGRFSVRHLPPGDYAVSAWRAETPVHSRVVTITTSQPVQEVELARATELGRLAGRITNASSRSSIAVLRREPQGLRRTAYCEVDPSGVFTEAVEPGRYALLVSDFAARAPFVWVPEVTLAAGTTTELALALPAARTVSIRLDAGESWTPRSIWRLRMPTGEWLPFVFFVGSESEGRRTGPRPFQLPLGTYAVEADFGDPVRVVREFTVQPGDGVQEIVVARP